jgi:hypothetical protein
MTAAGFLTMYLFFRGFFVVEDFIVDQIDKQFGKLYKATEPKT